MSALFVARTAGCHIFTESRQESLRKEWLLNNGAQRSASGLANDLPHVQGYGSRDDDASAECRRSYVCNSFGQNCVYKDICDNALDLPSVGLNTLPALPTV